VVILTVNIKTVKSRYLSEYSDQVTTSLTGYLQRRGRILSTLHSTWKALENSQPHILCLPGNPPSAVKHPSIEATHLPTFSTESKNAWSYTTISSYVYLASSLGTYFSIRTDWKWSQINSILKSYL
jgi:hypothetical protein